MEPQYRKRPLAVRRMAKRVLEEAGVPWHLPRALMEQQTREERVRRRKHIEQAFQEAERRVKAAEAQSVYVICGRPGQPVKIGVATDVEQRRLQLQTGHPWELRVHFEAEAFGGRARQIEVECHRRLQSRRLMGEWFDCEPDEAVEIVKAVMGRSVPVEAALAA